MCRFIKCFLEIQIDYIYRWPIVIPFCCFLKKHIKFVRHDLAFKNPCWEGFLNSCLMKKATMLSLISPEPTLHSSPISHTESLKKTLCSMGSVTPLWSAKSRWSHLPSSVAVWTMIWPPATSSPSCRPALRPRSRPNVRTSLRSPDSVTVCLRNWM